MITFVAYGTMILCYGDSHCVKGVRIQSECRKKRTRIIPNMNTFHAVSRLVNDIQPKIERKCY